MSARPVSRTARSISLRPRPCLHALAHRIADQRVAGGLPAVQPSDEAAGHLEERFEQPPGNARTLVAGDEAGVGRRRRDGTDQSGAEAGSSIGGHGGDALRRGWSRRGYRDAADPMNVANEKPSCGFATSSTMSIVFAKKLLYFNKLKGHPRVRFEPLKLHVCQREKEGPIDPSFTLSQPLVRRPWRAPARGP